MSDSVIHKAAHCAASLLVILALTACSDSKTTIVEHEPVPADEKPNDDHDAGQDHGEVAGRLLISARDEPHVYLLDLQEEKVVGDFDLEGVPTALYASHSRRYGLVVQGGDNGSVNFVDSGIYLEAHGDHSDLMKSAPMLMDFSMSGDRPAHVTQFNDQVAVFFDGNEGAPAMVSVVDEHHFDSGQEIFELNYAENQHGAAQVRGDYLLSTVRYPELDPESTLPTRVALYHLHGDHYDMEAEFEVDCPGLHGSAQNHHDVAFGCTDGVLLIEQDEASPDQFQARKIASEQRIGSLFGHEDMDGFVGVGSGVLYSVDTMGEGSITSIPWKTDDSLEPVGYAFADHGELFLVLDNQGGLTVLNTDDWELSGDRLQVTVSEQAPEDSRFELSVSGDGHYVYVSDPASREIVAVDIDHIEILERFELDFIPHKLAWLGVAGGVVHGH